MESVLTGSSDSLLTSTYLASHEWLRGSNPTRPRHQSLSKIPQEECWDRFGSRETCFGKVKYTS